MSNELLMILFTLTWLALALGAFKLGKVWLQAFVCISYVSLFATNSKFIDVLGFNVLIGLPVYAGIFLATDMLTERYGKKAGYQMVWISLGVGVLFVFVSQIALLFTPQPFSVETHEAMQLIYGSTLRMALAGYTVYFLVQRFDVWFYHLLHRWTGEKHLWLRNNASTLTSQFLDSFLFVCLAFYGTMPTQALIEIIASIFVAKAIIALLDTPFMYLAKRLTPLGER